MCIRDRAPLASCPLAALGRDGRPRSLSRRCSSASGRAAAARLEEGAAARLTSPTATHLRQRSRSMCSGSSLGAARLHDSTAARLSSPTASGSDSGRARRGAQDQHFDA
eukprot:14399196-Alexandrium_andersonii.AAC.1